MNKTFIFILSLCAPLTWADAAIQNGTLGFVVSEFAYALGPDAEETGACPDGLARNLQEIYILESGAKRRQNESEAKFEKRLQAAAKALGTAENGQDLCQNPEAGSPDPYFKTVQGSGFVVEGIDLDGKNSPEDFNDQAGSNGVDNQFYRTVGCSRSFQSTGQSNGFKIEMLAGSWGIVFELSNVDDIYNDEHVDVTISANADPIQLSAARVPLAFATYAKDQSADFRGSTTGRIVAGVLTTDPVDVRFHSVVNSMKLERPLLDARLQASFSDDGSLTGILAGYTPVEALYDVQYGYRNAMAVDGQLAPLALRQGSANGAAHVLGHTCHGVYHALYKNADARPDPQTGKFTAISTQYRFSAIPAFIVDIETESANSGLKQSREYGSDY
ncbi:hypothetical protein [Zhongshania aquimaris]|uniref:Uncharacterized protein n=1 Tax=Zhongshania aquimaris TaxID=2857107 RepID=A0ABS6VNQ1_9GAMM|nr:hypothetical protein [Zhongshania aquimaris]MBW2939931.1 hypothetical protein [Zhongshania aquimaris]